MSNTGALKYGTRNLPRGHAAGIQAQSQDIADAALNARKLSDRHQYFKFRSSPTGCRNTGAAASGATGHVNLLNFPPYGTLEQHILGAGQTIILPLIEAAGLNIALDQTDDEGAEYCAGITARSPGAFTIGTDPAFFTRVKLTIPDVSGTDDLVFGFRKTQAFQAAADDYTDFAAFNINAGSILLETALNNAATVSTDTTNTWADAATKELKVLVSAAGVVTYQIDGAAPTTVAAYTFDATDVVTAYLYFLHAADVAGAVTLDYWETGFQAGTG